jgi:hypothetical protein
VLATVSLLPCSVCKKRPRGRLATVYASFFQGSQRFGKRGRYCGICVVQLGEYVRGLKPIPSEDESIEWPETCPLCGGSISEDFDPTYLTVYMPKEEAVQIVVAACSSCAANLRPQVVLGMEPTVDRQAQGRVGGAAAPSHEAPGFPEVRWHF